MLDVINFQSNARGVEMFMAALPENEPFSQACITDYPVKAKQKTDNNKGKQKGHTWNITSISSSSSPSMTR